METRTYLVILLSVLAANIVTTQQQQQQCVSRLDLIFCVDGSNSMGNENFERLKTSLVNLVSHLNVSEDNIRVGLVLYSRFINAIIQLTSNKSGFITDTNALVYPDEETRTDLAINSATKMFNDTGRGGSVPRLVIIITDGQASEQNLATIAATDAKNQGIVILAIGITNSTNVDDLSNYASSRNQVFITEDFTTLEASLNNATSRACVDLQTITTVAPTVPAPPPVPACFMGQTDIWIVADVSKTTESLSRDQATGDFAGLKKGLTEMINVIQDPSVANPGVRLGLITFSDTSNIVSDISRFNSVNNVASAVQQIPGGIFQGGSNLASALRHIVMPPVVSSYRSYVFIVAPESSYSVNTTAVDEQMTRLKNLGYTNVVNVVRENGALNQQSLQMSASGSKFLYNVSRYSALEAATKNFTRDRLCNGLLSNSTGLCAESGHRENGVGIVAHPMDCDKYIQCYYDELKNIDLGVVRECPMGLHWNSENKTCSKPYEAKCAYDKCKEDCAAYKMEGSCGAYWECENGVSMAKCCQQNYTFVPDMGCQLDYKCTSQCSVEKWCGKCQKKPNWKEAAGYDVMILGGNMWMPRPCFYEDFDIVDCDCTSPRGQVCPADRIFDFTDSQTMKDIDGGAEEGIRVANVQRSTKGITLGRNSAVHVNVNHKKGENVPFTFELRFRELDEFSPYGEILYSSGINCGNSNSLIVSANNQFIFAQIRSAMGSVSEVKVPTKGLNKDEFKDLVLSYDNGVLSLSIKDEKTQYIAKSSAPTDICFTCGLDVGEGLNKLSFDGEIQKIAVYSCAWPLLY
uniref:VWFA domain-containing protein n=1 Tax=Arion vulgaris TaxID=1028688 RepID=A0A0B7A6W9_9EUPU